MSYDFIKIKNDNELYNRISNLMNRWKIDPDDAVKLIISVETSQYIYINSMFKKYIFLYRIHKAKKKIKNDILILKKYR